ncbi:unnamed protein product [Ambrosiozyma monospora]|uniref:Unnamed protein product n=1 Tax=Ambrosiozyma monospora TaxID=43982 RepID=A0A9W6YPA1_AMBMO|nr:unnamed protein product [Ambrosiozyma monospora]
MVESFSLLCFHGPRPIKPQTSVPRRQTSGLRTQDSGGQRPDGRRQTPDARARAQTPDSRLQSPGHANFKVHLNTANRPPALNSKLV